MSDTRVLVCVYWEDREPTVQSHPEPCEACARSVAVAQSSAPLFRQYGAAIRVMCAPCAVAFMERDDPDEIEIRPAWVPPYE